MNERPLILLLGASGCGKSAVAEKLEKQYGLKQAQSFTTREPRFAGEPGHTFIDYGLHLQMMIDGVLVAYTQVNGAFYGATKEMVDDADIYVIDPYGARILHDRYKTDRPIYYIYLTATEDDRTKRMATRGTPEELKAREDFDLSIMDQAIQVGELYSHTLTIENRNLLNCVNEIAKFVGLEE